MITQQGTNLADWSLDVNQLRALSEAIHQRIETLEELGDPSMRVALQTLLSQVIAETPPDEEDTDGEEQA